MLTFKTDLISLSRTLEIRTILYHAWGTAKQYKDSERKEDLWKIDFIGDHVCDKVYETTNPYDDLQKEITDWVQFIHLNYPASNQVSLMQVPRRETTTTP